MALGNQQDNNKDKNEKQVTVYSAYGFWNKEAEVDPSCISTEFWNKLLKISISPAIVDEYGQVKYDHNKKGFIYLNHTKAFLLAKEIELFLANPDANPDNGVSNGSETSTIHITNGHEFGIDSPCLVIRKIENDEIVSTHVYQFRADNYSIRNFGTDGSGMEKTMYPTLEIELLHKLLMEYVTAMTGAVAYSVQEYGKYNDARLTNKIDAISEKMGIKYERPNTGSNTTTKSSSSMFNNAPIKNHELGSIEDINSLM